MKLTVKKLWPIRKQFELSPEQPNNGDTEKATKHVEHKVWREVVAYWILGLCTEMGYILMLCAAHDILHGFQESKVICFFVVVSLHIFLLLL